MVEIFTQWQRESERRPFNTEAWNRLMRWLSGYASGPLTLINNSGVPILSVTDSGNVTALAINSGDVGITGNLTFLGTVRRLKADLSNATISNRLLAQSSTTDGQSRLGIIPNGTATKAGWAAYSSSAPENSHYVELVANATDNAIDLITTKAGSGTTRDVRLIVDSTVVAKLVASTLALRLENTRWLAGYSTGAAEIGLIRLNASDIIETGQTGTRHNLLGTVVAPSINPPTVNGQVVAGSVASAWAHFTVAGGAVTLRASHNVSGVTYNAAGDYSVAWDRDFASVYYACTVSAVDNGGIVLAPKVNSQVAGSADVWVYNAAATKVDPDAVSVVAFGTLS